MSFLKEKKILVTGGKGFIGSHVTDILQSEFGVSKENLVIPASEDYDLRILDNCFKITKGIDVVLHLAAKVGGVGYSSKFPATQYYDNILMDLQIVEAARQNNVKKFVLVSSSCAYPKDCEYPLREDYLFDGLPQETNRAYGIAKRIEVVQAEAYQQQYGMNIVVVIPNNAYGPRDHFSPEYSHVIPSLIKKCLESGDNNEVVLWGDGTPTRDFLYVKDFARGVILAALKLKGNEPVNLGSGVETSIKELAQLIAELTGFNGHFVYDTSKPNGQPRRSVDISRAKNLLGFVPAYSLKEGLKETIAWYKENFSLIT
ncbi:TPA: GDP-fucose synthetase [Candidatus Peregrinibacteria bacterium]|nr:GDP-fucose synthetase [Candidatus Peregrinibacteria bacterium]